MAKVTFNVKSINILDVKVGDILHAHGARFEVTSVVTREERDPKFIDKGLIKVISANGKWLAGAIEPGYFGPTKDWTFQGNALAFVGLEID